MKKLSLLILQSSSEYSHSIVEIVAASYNKKQLTQLAIRFNRLDSSENTFSVVTPDYVSLVNGEFHYIHKHESDWNYTMTEDQYNFSLTEKTNASITILNSLSFQDICDIYLKITCDFTNLRDKEAELRKIYLDKKSGKYYQEKTNKFF